MSLSDWDTKTINEGRYTIVFTNNVVRSVNVDRVIYYANGAPMFIIGDDETIYNYGTIISMKKHGG